MTNTFRLEQNLNSENLPIWALDKYADFGVLQAYSEIEYEKLSAELLKKYQLKGIYLKKRFINDPKQEDLTELVAGVDAPDEIIVIENDLKFLIKLKERLDVGLFLDHRVSREIIRDYAKNKDVLNLFAYTGSFSVYCAAAGAKSTTTVDLSNNYCTWAQKNLELNGFNVNYKERGEGAQNEIWNEDVFEFIQIAIETGSKYDIIILDPPSFSRNKSKVFNVQNDHVKLIKDIQEHILNPGGILFFSTNLSTFVLSPYIRPGADKLTKKTVPQEFQPFRAHQSFVFYG